VAEFPVISWSLQRVSQMEHKDMLYATYKLKIAIFYIGIKDISPGKIGIHELGMLTKRSNKLPI
jgi:hypothetical protein